MAKVELMMAKRKSGSGTNTDQAIKQIFDLVDDFCKEHLNDEYADLCRKLTEKLARKRPTPLISGKPNSWASGIVRTIGWVNFLDDKTQKPHMKLTAIDKAFGVGESTGQGKSMLIRKMLEWTWDGNDEMESAHGRGWAIVEGSELHGMIFFHDGDDSEFVAKKKGETDPKSKKSKK